MSDLVGNPEDRFSRVEAQFWFGFRESASTLSLIQNQLGLSNSQYTVSKFLLISEHYQTVQTTFDYFRS